MTDTIEASPPPSDIADQRRASATRMEEGAETSLAWAESFKTASLLIGELLQEPRPPQVKKILMKQQRFLERQSVAAGRTAKDYLQRAHDLRSLAS